MSRASDIDEAARTRSRARTTGLGRPAAAGSDDAIWREAFSVVNRSATSLPSGSFSIGRSGEGKTEEKGGVAGGGAGAAFKRKGGPTDGSSNDYNDVLLADMMGNLSVRDSIIAKCHSAPQVATALSRFVMADKYSDIVFVVGGAVSSSSSSSSTSTPIAPGGPDVAPRPSASSSSSPTNGVVRYAAHSVVIASRSVILESLIDTHLQQPLPDDNTSASRPCIIPTSSVIAFGSSSPAPPAAPFAFTSDAFAFSAGSTTTLSRSTGPPGGAGITSSPAPFEFTGGFSAGSKSSSSSSSSSPGPFGASSSSSGSGDIATSFGASSSSSSENKSEHKSADTSETKRAQSSSSSSSSSAPPPSSSSSSSSNSGNGGETKSSVPATPEKKKAADTVDIRLRYRAEIPLPDVDPVLFRHVLECIYTDRVYNMKASLLAPLSALAKKYEIEVLKQYCNRYVADNLTADNALSFFADDTLGSDEMDRVIKLLQSDAAAQVNRSGWLTLPPHRVKQFISFSTLNIPEIDLFKALVRWGKAQVAKQSSTTTTAPKETDSKASPAEVAKPLRDLLAEYVTSIRFGVMSMTELAETVGPTHVLSTEDMVALFTWMTTPTDKPTIKWQTKARDMAPILESSSASFGDPFGGGFGSASSLLASSSSSSSSSSGRIGDDRGTKRAAATRDTNDRAGLGFGDLHTGFSSSSKTSGSGSSSSSSSSSSSGGFSFSSTPAKSSGTPLFSTKSSTRHGSSGTSSTASGFGTSSTGGFGSGSSWGAQQEDEELRRVLALSLAESAATKK